MRSFLKIVAGLMLLSIQTFFLTGCDKSFEAGARENTTTFFRTVNLAQRGRTADPENLLEKKISILNDRLFIQMPEGAGIMNERQRKALHAHPISDLSVEQYIVWGGSGEVLTLHAKEVFGSSDQVGAETASYLKTYKTWMNQEPTEISDSAVAISLPLDQISRSREGKLEFMRALVLGAGNTLVSIEFSLYTTAFDQLDERIDFFKNVAISIVQSATQGTRILGAEEQTVTFEKFTMQIPKGYCVVNRQKKSIAFNKEDRGNAFVNIRELVPLDAPFCSIRIDIGSNLKLRYPESVISLKEDVLFNKPNIWQRQQGTMGEGYPFDFYETIIQLSGDEYLKILISPKPDADIQSLFDIIHTLKKK